jgi:hypothetical protein
MVDSIQASHPLFSTFSHTPACLAAIPWDLALFTWEIYTQPSMLLLQLSYVDSFCLASAKCLHWEWGVVMYYSILSERQIVRLIAKTSVFGYSLFLTLPVLICCTSIHRFCRYFNLCDCQLLWMQIAPCHDRVLYIFIYSSLWRERENLLWLLFSVAQFRVG